MGHLMQVEEMDLVNVQVHEQREVVSMRTSWARKSFGTRGLYPDANSSSNRHRWNYQLGS